MSDSVNDNLGKMNPGIKFISRIVLQTSTIDEEGKLNLNTSNDVGFGEATEESHKRLEGSILQEGGSDTIEGV